MTKSLISRRNFLRQSGGMVTAGAALGALPGLVAAMDNVTVGFIYVGPRQDYGWNQSHWDAAKKVAAIDGVTVVEQENVPETAEVEKVIQSMIELDGARVIFGTSFGYWDSLKKMALQYPDVLFTHIGAIWKEGDPANVIGYRGYTEEAHYLCGIAAGRMSKTGKIGFIGSKPLYFIYNNCNGFVLGAQSVNPEMTCNVVITGDWNNPVKEAETTNSLIDQGCDVIIANVDSPKVSVETAEARGVYTCGYHSDLSALAPNGFLTGAEWNWASGVEFVEAFVAGDSYPNLKRGGFKEDMVAISPFGDAVPQEVRDEVLAAKQGFIDDTLKLYKGPLEDNKGNVILEEGEVIENTDTPFKLGVDWFVKGTTG
ncbi:BMP family ABC transporter substrate-binding protein [Roseovarius aestuariivivens]|uniref:BMP family ABC transporter substrate-binding protein n=1 Tax=Roseovarius aestuariivivens TaxID=1888910 RepID=UPI0010813284|nr:BMP family ABC transporter substrate-binding protein [Roseovarius aestuariivivens]